MVSIKVSAGLASGTGAANGPKGLAREWDAGYREGKRSLAKPARRRTTETSVTYDDGVERRVHRSFDYAGDWYSELILNPDGSTYRFFEEPLSKHRGHGSDKSR